MRQLLLTSSGPRVKRVPLPALRPGEVLVRVAYSAISAGTELALLTPRPEQPLWRQALERARKLRRALRLVMRPQAAPEQARRALQFVRTQALGYSVSGEVVQVGEGVNHFRPGDRVACAGAQCAFHADWVCVPWQLVVAVPAEVELSHAATVALGAVALHGVRQASPQLGEQVAVAGLGLLGNLCVQMFRAAGCGVIGWDPQPQRLAIALACGLKQGYLVPSVAEVFRDTQGLGVDAALVAAGAGAAVVHQAASMCRDRGRLVLLGNTPVSVERNLFFQRELELRITRSYGPGRYDPAYEEQGQSYPVGYVRWTETRNMAAYLEMLASGQVGLKALQPRIFPLQEGEAAYHCLQEERPLLVVLDCQGSSPAASPRAPHAPGPSRPGAGPLGVALVGPGAFARQVHLPHVLDSPHLWQLRSVVARQGHQAFQVASSLGVRASTWDEMLVDSEVQVVILCTRHDLHAPMALQALRAGKHLLLEKPLCLSQIELAQICDYCRCAEGSPRWMVGFNRAFSPTALALKSRLQKRRGPALLNYRVQAGPLPPDHWIYSSQGGGRNLGEACHFYHLLLWLLESEGRVVAAVSGGSGPRTDHFTVSLAFAEGSLANLSYTAAGDTRLGKEWLDVCFDDQSVQLFDFRELRRAGQLCFVSPGQDKGHRAMLEAFGNGVLGGTQALPLEPQLRATEMALEVEALLRGQGSELPLHPLG